MIEAMEAPTQQPYINGTAAVEPAEPEITEEMIKAYQEREAKRSNECAQEVQAVLDKWGYKLSAVADIQIVKAK